MGLFDAPSRTMVRESGDIYREKADRLAEETRLLFTRGRMADAEERVRELIALQSRVVGERHPEYATGLCILAEVLSAQDELADAETLIQRALEVRKKALGENHPDYAAGLDQMARLMLRWEDLSGAEPLLRKALEIRRATLGETHPDSAASLAALAEVLHKRDASDEAEPLLLQALAVLRGSRGESHPDVAATLCTLADVLQYRNRFEEAEGHLRQAIEIYKQELGETHPDYVAALSALASLLQKKGDLGGAEPIWRLLLDMKRQGQGPHNAGCVAIQTQLGLLLQRRGDMRGAEAMFRQAAEACKGSLGERHPEYAVCLTNLALLLQRVGDLAGAEPLLRQSLAVRKEVLGPRHPDYATSLLTLAQLVQKRGDTTWARMLLKEAVEVRRVVFGEHNAEYAQSLSALADVHAQQGETSKAEALLRQSLEVRRTALGENHPVYAANLSSLAGVLRRQGDLDGAEALIRQALQIRKSALGENHPDYTTNLGNLAWLLQKKGDRQGAEDCLTLALEIRRRLLGEQHPEYQQNLERLKTLQDVSPPAATEPRAPVSSDAPHAHPLFFAGRHPHTCLTPKVEDAVASPPEAAEPPAPGAVSGPVLEEPSETAPLPDTECSTEQPEADGVLETDDGPGDLLKPSGLDEFIAFCLSPRDEELRENPEPDPDGVCRNAAAEVEDVESASAHEVFAAEPSAVDEAEALAEPRPFEETQSGGAAVRPEEGPDRNADSSTTLTEERLVDPIRPSTDATGLVTEEFAAVPVDGADGLETGSASCVEAEEADGRPEQAVVVEAESVNEIVQQPIVPDTRPLPVAEAPMPGVRCAVDAEPARSPSMSQSRSHLSHELAAMSDRFSELGERLLTAARQLHAPGTPPDDELVESLGACRREFNSLRDRARDLALSLFVACPQGEQVTSLEDVTNLLDHIAEAEIHQSKSEELRRRSLSVIDRVLGLSHSSNPDFSPLREVHEQARALRGGIVEGVWNNLPTEAERLAEGQHHLADLLTLIEDRDELSDEMWSTLHENVSQAFGKPLVAAVARAKLLLPSSHQPSESHHGEMAASQH